MKKNYFSNVLQQELSFLCKAAGTEDPSVVISCYQACEKLHQALSKRLFQAFITPRSREDLYRLSVDILALFSPLLGSLSCGREERDRIRRTVALFDVFLPDERALVLCSELYHLWDGFSCSEAARKCREGFFHLSEQMVVTALKNV